MSTVISQAQQAVVPLPQKIEHAKSLIRDAMERYKRVAVACSFGKDSMVTVHLAREVDPNIKVFGILTQYKPLETFEYARLMNERMGLRATIYIVADSAPELLERDGLDVRLLPADEFNRVVSQTEKETGKKIYAVSPDECCRLLKVVPTQIAVQELDAWITGLRNTEGRTRVDYQEVEEKGGLIKINPILSFTEAEIWIYMATRGIQPHPWYSRGYRSLGCEPCSHPGGVMERDGRWQNTSKCGGECGIHTQRLK